MAEPIPFKFNSVAYVPALPGFFLVDKVHEGDKVTLEICEPIIAWRLVTSTRVVHGDSEVHTECDPVTALGFLDDGYEGWQNPNGTVTLKHGDYFKSIAHAQEDYSAKKAKPMR